MSSFTYIISSFFPSTNIREVAYHRMPETDEVINKNFIDYAFLNTLSTKPESLIRRYKYTILFDSVVNNNFLADPIKEDLLNIFSKAQKVYLGFCTLAKVLKMKDAKVYDTHTDLCMNPLGNLKESTLIRIYDDTTRIVYCYRISDIMNIIHTSLSNAPDFFVEPSAVKNPYTNVPFTDSQLYHIYFTIRNCSHYIMPVLFQQYFRSNFDMVAFARYNECFIRDVAIKNFMNSSDYDRKAYYVTDLLKEYSRALKSIIVHPRFPREKLVKTFEVYLEDYLTSKYSLNHMLKFSIRKSLHRRLVNFDKLNPTYGRKIYYLQSRYTSDRPFPFTPSPLTSSELLLSYNNDNTRNVARFNYNFVDTVFTEASSRRPSESNLYLRGLTSEQSIIPPLPTRTSDDTFAQIPYRVRSSLDHIIDSIHGDDDTAQSTESNTSNIIIQANSFSDDNRIDDSDDGSLSLLASGPNQDPPSSGSYAGPRQYSESDMSDASDTVQTPDPPESNLAAALAIAIPPPVPLPPLLFPPPPPPPQTLSSFILDELATINGTATDEGGAAIPPP